jgi:molybdenum cofactor synthesis domain-containing protein
MANLSNRISYMGLEEAFRKLVETCEPKPDTELISINDAYRRLLAEDVESPINIPSHDKSHVDGYTVHAEDTSSASPDNPVTLRLSGKITLLEIPEVPLMRSETLKIPTGGILPKGADAIVHKELVCEENGLVKIFGAVSKGKEVVHSGSDVRKNEIILRKGTNLRAPELALLKALGLPQVRVYRKPLVAIISVGSELTNDPREIALGKVLNSHALVIAKLVEEAGGIPRDLGIAPDNQESIKMKINEGIEEASIILTIGGSSMGDADLVSDTIKSMGEPGMVVHGLKVQPGRVSGFGSIKNKPIILLPGLIQSTVNAFILLVYPLIRIFIGLPPTRQTLQIPVKITKPIRYTTFPEFRHITWVKIIRTQDGFHAEPILGDSPMLNVLIKADAYILTPENTEMLDEGDVVEANLLPGLGSIP